MTTEIIKFLGNLDERFEIIKNQISKYFDDKSNIRKDGAAEIFNRPWVAPLNYGIIVFPGVEKLWFNKFKEKTGIEIPYLYQDVLLKMNGCRIYNFNLYGLPKSIYEESLLDRTIVQQLSLESANTTWKNSYNIADEYFYIGGRRFDENENLGYFVFNDKIISIRKNGEIINSWKSFENFLNEEIKFEEIYMLQQRN